jgi:Immunity protein 61
MTAESLRATIAGFAEVADYGVLVGTDGALQVYDKKETEFIYIVSESGGMYAVSRSERRGPADPLAWNLSEDTAAKYLVTELGTSLRYARRLPQINRFYAPGDLQAGFTLLRGERGEDSLYRDGSLVGTFYSNGIAIPAVFYSLVAHLSVDTLEAAYLAPDGGALSVLIKPAT